MVKMVEETSTTLSELGNRKGLKRDRVSLELPATADTVFHKKPKVGCLQKSGPVRKSKRSSIYRGVCWLKERKAWRARIEIKGRREHLGYFASEKEAAMAYDKRARLVTGRSTRLNFPELAAESGKSEKPNNESTLVTATAPTTSKTDFSARHLDYSNNPGVYPFNPQMNAPSMLSTCAMLLNLQQQVNMMQLQRSLASATALPNASNDLGKANYNWQFALQSCIGRNFVSNPGLREKHLLDFSKSLPCSTFTSE